MKCPYCEKDITRRFGHYDRHVEKCDKRPRRRDDGVNWKPAAPRVSMGGNVQVWKRG